MLNVKKGLRVQHDLAQKHILQSAQRLRILDRIIPFESFVKVRKRGFEVTFIGGVKNSCNRNKLSFKWVTSKIVYSPDCMSKAACIFGGI